MWQRFLFFLLLFGFAEFYSFIVVRSALRTLPGAWRAGITVLYLAVTTITWLGFLFFRQIDWAGMPHMIRNFYVAFTIGLLVGKLLVLVVMLGDEVRRAVVWAASKFQAAPDPVVAEGKGITRSVFLSRLALVLGGTTLAGFLYGITNRYDYKIRRVKLSFSDLPAAFKGLKIVQISDVHSGSFDRIEKVTRGIDLIMAEKPDVIFFTGDLVNNKADEMQPYTGVFSKLTAPLGVYSIFGNHDYGDYWPWPDNDMKLRNHMHMRQTHANMGWKLLMNEHVILEKGEDKLAVIGVENWSARAGFSRYGNMGKAYNGLHEQPSLFKILLSHDPSHWDAEVREKYPDIRLTLSGHTHGMQFGVEIPGLKWSPVQYIYGKWAGLYREGSQYLYVNRGFGFLGYPGRLGILPEITVIELA